MINRLLVCGCARSGNTLMLHLLDTGFKDTEIVYDGPGGEVVPTEEDITEGKVVIGKFPKKANKLSKWLKDEHFGAVYMMRDPRDVLVSKHWLKPGKFWVQPKRWIQTAEIAEQYKDHERVLLVKYEDLLRNPEDIQRKISVKFGLEITRSFNECHSNFDKNDVTNINNMNGARPFDSSRIGNWTKDKEKKQYVERTLKAFPDIKKWMHEFGYHSKS